jgi:UDP-N-acetylmuramoyl-tripeptide--D-alanyl-D-alanine ligase
MKSGAIRIADAIAWRLHGLLGDRLVYGGLLSGAKIWRRVLKKTVFVGVVGSAGKTTAKELFTGMLANHGHAAGNRASFNNIEEIAKAMLGARPWHRAFVSELSEDQPGVVQRQVALLRPSVGIVTVVKDDHLAAFESREALAGEMQALVASLPTTGTAVLNADDPLVLAMASNSKAKVLTYGLSSQAELRAEDVNSAWPDRLQMTLVYGTQRVKLVTQLCGAHWIPSVLGAIGGGLATGLTLEECAKGIAEVAPFEGRMQPVATPEGVTFIRDDFKAPLWTLDACFEFMREAKAERKIIVMGELSEIASKKGNKYAKTAAIAQEIADQVIFVGPWSSSVLAARTPGRTPEALQTFSRVRDAANYLNTTTREGDLVLLKGSAKKDHLFRIILDRQGEIACWRDDCGRAIFCSQCPDRMKPSGAALATRQLPVAGQVEINATARIIVGLGNPGPQYRNTPHNVGYDVVDRIASSCGLVWRELPEAALASGSWDGHAVCLLKINRAINLTGETLKRLSENMAFNPERCVLVFDDLDLPILTVKTRLGGSAGGHRGVASILEAFQTDSFRRVKVGVAPVGNRVNRMAYVLKPFDAPGRATMDEAIVNASAQVAHLIKQPTSPA